MSIRKLQLLVPSGLFLYSLVQLWRRYPHNHGGGFGGELAFGLFVWGFLVIVGAAQKRFSWWSLVLMLLCGGFFLFCDLFNLYVPYERWIERGMPAWGGRSHSTSRTGRSGTAAPIPDYDCFISGWISSSGGRGTFVDGRYAGYIAPAVLCNNGTNAFFLACSPNLQNVQYNLERRADDGSSWVLGSTTRNGTTNYIEIPGRSTSEFEIVSDVPFLPFQNRIILFGKINNPTNGDLKVKVVLYPDTPEKTELIPAFP